MDAGDDIQAQASYATLVLTPVLTSTAAETKTVPPESAPTSLLNVIRVVNVPSTSALFVGSDVAVDVAADVTINKAADHANVSTDIDTVVEKIGHEDGKKSVELDVIGDMAEDAVDEAVAQSGVENDDGHGADEEIVGATDENVVDHVSHTSTHTYNPTIN